MTRRALLAGVALACAGSMLGACTEVEQSAAPGYEPAKLVEGDGGKALRVTFTEEGARRTALQTAPVERRGGDAVVPYLALLYDGDGRALLYEVVGPRTFARTAVEVEEISGDRVRLHGGPEAGARVVTVGAAEVFGAESGIAGDH